MVIWEGACAMHQNSGGLEKSRASAMEIHLNSSKLLPPFRFACHKHKKATALVHRSLDPFASQPNEHHSNALSLFQCAPVMVLMCVLVFFCACLEGCSSIERVSAPEALQCLPGIPTKAPLTLPEAKKCPQQCDAT